MEHDLEQLKADVRATLDWTERQFPVEIFKEPKPGRHGTVDGCSARGVRHAVDLMRLQMERTFARREAPSSACRQCLDMIHGLVTMEIYKHSWHLTGGPQIGTGPAHWAKITSYETKGFSQTRQSYTLRAVCGVTFGYEVDSGD